MPIRLLSRRCLLWWKGYMGVEIAFSADLLVTVRVCCFIFRAPCSLCANACKHASVLVNVLPFGQIRSPGSESKISISITSHKTV